MRLESDRSGVATAGGNPWPAVRRLLRAVLVVALLLLVVVLAVVLGAFRAPHRPLVAKVKRWWCQQLLRLLGVRIETIGQPLTTPAFVVSNHISWLDIPVIASLQPVYFLSKAEVGEWPLIGMLARAAGTLFIKRGSGESGRKAKEIAARLRQAHTVLVFPEGTTTSGTTLRPFYPQLFDAPRYADAPVQPLAIRYLTDDGGVDADIAFTGDDQFQAHLWRILLRRNITVRLTYTPLLPVSSNSSRDSLCEQAHDQIRLALKLP